MGRGWRDTYAAYAHAREAVRQRNQDESKKKRATTALNMLSLFVPMACILTSTALLCLSFERGGGFGEGAFSFTLAGVPFYVGTLLFATVGAIHMNELSLMTSILWLVYWILPALYADGVIHVSYFVVLIPLWLIAGPMVLCVVAIPCAWILLYCHRHRNWREICSEQLTLSLAGVGGAGGFMWVLLICLRHDGTITWPWFYCTLPLIVMTVAGIAYLLGIIVPLRNDRCTPCGMAIMATPLLPFEVIYALRLDGTLTCSWWLVFIPVFVELGILNVCALLGVIGMSCNADPDQGNRQATCDLFWREVASHIGATPRQIDWLRSQQKKKRTSRCRPPRDDRACKDDAEEKRPASGEGHGAAGGTDQASDTDDNSTISGPDNDNNEDRATKADYVGLHRAHRKADAQDGEDAGAPDALGDVGDTPPELGPEEPTLDAPVAVAVAAAVPAPATDAAAPAIAPPPLQLR